MHTHICVKEKRQKKKERHNYSQEISTSSYLPVSNFTFLSKASREWWSQQSWKWQHRDPCLMLASCPQSSLPIVTGNRLLFWACSNQKVFLTNYHRKVRVSKTHMLTFSSFFSVAANTDRRTPVRNTLFFWDEKWISITDIEYNDCGTKKRLNVPNKRCWCQQSHGDLSISFHCLLHRQQCASCGANPTFLWPSWSPQSHHHFSLSWC